MLRRVVVALVVVTFGFGGGTAAAAPLPPNLTGNPTPGTDAFALVVRQFTGGTERICGVSPLGIRVHCVEHLNVQPSADPTASGTTFGHWVFCRVACTGSLLQHELVHVRQFERYGDIFGPLYLAEAARHGTGCENKYEREAYQKANGTCFG
jgi:hypothetical protein